MDIKEYRERHRVRYVEALSRVVKALQLPEEQRLKHFGLYTRLIEEARTSRIRAVTGFSSLDDGPITFSDPLGRAVDSSFGTIEEVARRIVAAMESAPSSLAEVLDVLGAEVVDVLGAEVVEETPGEAHVRGCSKTACVGTVPR